MHSVRLGYAVSYSCAYLLQSTTDPNQFTHHEVTQFHIQNWSAQGKCSDVLTITNVIEEMYRVQRKTGNNPVVVHCRLVVLLIVMAVQVLSFY